MSFDDAFIGKLAHALRGPLFPVVALSDLMIGEEDVDPEQWKKHAEVISGAGEDLMALIDDLHALAKERTGRGPISVDALQRDLTKEHGANFRSECSESFEVDAGAAREAAALLFRGSKLFSDGTVRASGSELLEFSISIAGLTDSDRDNVATPFWAFEGLPRAPGAGLLFPRLAHVCERVGGKLTCEAGDTTRVVASLPAIE